jgi:hypothetical protein
MPTKNQYKNKLEYNNTYNRNNYRSFSVRFNNKTETNLIEWENGAELTAENGKIDLRFTPFEIKTFKLKALSEQ